MGVIVVLRRLEMLAQTLGGERLSSLARTPPPSHPTSYALGTGHDIVNTSPFLHVSFNIPGSPFPMILPMIGHMRSFARPFSDETDVLDLYLHGYVSSRFVNIARSSTATEEGLPVCVAASHVDGLVMALTPNSHSYNYGSAVLFGHAALVEDASERLYAMQLITNGVVPGRWQGTRVPPNNAELSPTSILKVTVTAGSAKIRSGPPSDDKNDKTDNHVVGTVWNGVVPVHLSFGEPVAGPYNAVDLPPSYLTEHISDSNNAARERAIEAAHKV
ncbi:hypothetical protein C8034_v012120 [Colletotrichum sidae]|uniref:Flavin-nucleotide-binding protein n=1 Tax=Colletotrichum sidae TaxID=1347389 RepID=A0A4R8T0N6_9PEZI|nr:hypothetical protein C8034_v012120 [Colletotrichum sidae]